MHSRRAPRSEATRESQLFGECSEICLSRALGGSAYVPAPGGERHAYLVESGPRRNWMWM